MLLHIRHDGWDQSRLDTVDKPITASATRRKSLLSAEPRDQNSQVNYREILICHWQRGSEDYWFECIPIFKSMHFHLFIFSHYELKTKCFPLRSRWCAVATEWMSRSPLPVLQRDLAPLCLYRVLSTSVYLTEPSLEVHYSLPLLLPPIMPLQPPRGILMENDMLVGSSV